MDTLAYTKSTYRNVKIDRKKIKRIKFNGFPRWTCIVRSEFKTNFLKQKQHFIQERREKKNQSCLNPD